MSESDGCVLCVWGQREEEERDAEGEEGSAVGEKQMAALGENAGTQERCSEGRREEEREIDR